MLLLGTDRTIEVDGIQAFPDDAVATHYWYLPGPVALARDRDRRPRLDLYMYVGDADDQLDDGGFLVFEVELRLDPEVERRLRTRLRAVAGSAVTLAAAPFDEGTVSVMALDLSGPGGTTAVAADGSFRVVEKIHGAVTPSLGNRNNAIFSLKLSKDGATIVSEALRKRGRVPVGALYSMKYTALRPALEVTITADMAQVYTQFSASLEAQIYYVRAGIDAGFEKLVKDGAITIEVKNYSTAADRADREKWALDFFKENLLARWFEPTLTPGALAGTPARADPLADVIALGQKLRPSQPAPPAAAAATPPARRPSAKPTAGDPDAGSGAPEKKGLAPQPVAPSAPDQPPGAGSGVAGEAPATAAPATAPAVDLPAVAGRAPDLGASISPVSFKLKFVRQEERKTIRLELNRAEAVSMPYNPQGMFENLVDDVDPDTLITRIDLDAAFFREFDVEVASRIAFDPIGLNSAQVVLDYGDPAVPDLHKHHDVMITRTDPVPRVETWRVPMATIQANEYRRSVQYTFDPQSSWEGPYEITVPAELVDDRRYEINPYAHVSFLEVEVRADPLLDWGIVTTVDVDLRVTPPDDDPTAPTAHRTLTVREGDPPHTWRVRAPAQLDDADVPVPLRYERRLTYHLADGSTREVSGDGPGSASTVNLSNPFAGTLAIEIRPLLPAGVTYALVDITYSDPPYRRSVTVEITTEQGRATVLKHIAIDNPDQRHFVYQITLIGDDNSVTERPAVETDNPRILVR